MPKKKQPIELNRRSPKQLRAQRTVETIFEATARIIEREGGGALNTNRIAERAGISVGTLYEYFTNKEAVLIAMARRQLEEDEWVVRQAISQALDEPGASVTRVAIRALADLHQRHPKVRRVIMMAHIAGGLGSEHAKPVEDVAEMLAARNDRIAADASEPISRAALFVLTRAVIGVIRAAFEERSSLLGQRELEDELVRLADAYLRQPRGVG